MMKNCNHDLIQQLSECMDSLWRYDEYIKNAQEKGCGKCVELWQKMKELTKEQIKLLKQYLEECIKEGKFEFLE